MKSGHISGQVVYDVVRRRVTAAHLDPASRDVALLGGHSLRAGFVTEALRAGATHHEVMRQTGMRDPGTVEIYAREYVPLEANAVTKIGL